MSERDSITVIPARQSITAGASQATQATMTSQELVKYINQVRAPGEPALRHDHFMAKVPKVLGEDHAPKFRDMVSVSIGSGATRQSPIYRFPKREACLMAMSYSYELQAKVYDHMTALEEKLRKMQSAQALKDERRRQRLNVADSSRVMAEALQETRAQQSKETKHYHYSNEHRMINEIATGSPDPVDRDKAPVHVLELLHYIEMHNSVLVLGNWSYQERKERLRRLAEVWKAKQVLAVQQRTAAEMEKLITDPKEGVDALGYLVTTVAYNMLPQTRDVLGFALEKQRAALEAADKTD